MRREISSERNIQPQKRFPSWGQISPRCWDQRQQGLAKVSDYDTPPCEVSKLEEAEYTYFCQDQMGREAGSPGTVW